MSRRHFLPESYVRTYPTAFYCIYPNGCSLYSSILQIFFKLFLCARCRSRTGIMNETKSLTKEDCVSVEENG